MPACPRLPIFCNEFQFPRSEEADSHLLHGFSDRRSAAFFDAEEGEPNRPYKAIITTVYDKTGDGGVDMFDVAELFRTGENELTELEGDGDFRSPECLALLDEAEIFLRTLIQCPAHGSVENGLKQRLSADLSVLLKAVFFYVLK